MGRTIKARGFEKAERSGTPRELRTHQMFPISSFQTEFFKRTACALDCLGS